MHSRGDHPDGLVGDGLFPVGRQHEPALRLRHDLGGDSKDVALLQLANETPDDDREVISRHYLGNALDRPDCQH
jgi:hypothetical protein